MVISWNTINKNLAKNKSVWVLLKLYWWKLFSHLLNIYKLQNLENRPNKKHTLIG